MFNLELITELLLLIDKGIEEYSEEFLLGSIKLEKETYEELLVLSSILINNKMFLPKDKKYSLISLAMVNFAIKEYQNGQFWYEFASKLGIDESDVMQIGKKSIEEFCKIKGLYFHVGNINKGYRTTILIHAIIPNSSLYKFIEFLQDIYFKDLEEDYIDEEVEELIQYMNRLFGKYLEEEDISFNVQGSKLTIARQQLPKAFRIAFVKSANLVAPIIERLLLYINQSNYGEGIDFLANDRFDDYFSNYEYANRKINSTSRKHMVKKDKFKKFQIAQYYYDNNNLYLQIPRQIIDSDYIDSVIYLEIMFGDLVIHQQELLLTKSRLFFKTKQLVVQIPEFHEKISYCIKSGNQVIYKSNTLLYRDYLIFDLNGKEINPRNLTDETVKVITYTHNEVLTDDALIHFADFSNYRVFTVFLNEESLLLINDKILSTNVASIKNGLKEKNKYNGVKVSDLNNIVFDVYTEIPDIVLRIPYGLDIEDFILSINEGNLRISETADISIKKILDGSGDQLAIVTIKEEFLVNNNPVKIIVRKKGENRIYIEENIFILKSLNFKLDKSYYYKEKKAQILELHSNELELKERLNFPLELNIKKNKIFSTEFKYNSNRFIINFELPIVAWRFGSINSGLKTSDNLWWEDIDDYKLYIKFLNTGSNLYIVSNINNEIIQGKKIGDEYKFTLDHLFQTTEKESITLGIILDGIEEKITEIHYKPTIRNFSIEYFDNSYLMNGLIASWSFFGKGKLYADIIYCPTDKIVKTYEIEQYNGIIDKDINLYYNEHRIEIYQLNEDDFFGEGNTKSILWTEKFIVGDPILVKYKNKTLKGIQCTSETDKYEIDNFYIKNIKFSKKRGYYEATGYYIVRDLFTGENREKYFIRYNPFFLKAIENKSSRVTFEIVDKDKDGLIVDLKTKHINPKELHGKAHKYKLIDAIVFEIVE